MKKIFLIFFLGACVSEQSRTISSEKEKLSMFYYNVFKAIDLISDARDNRASQKYLEKYLNTDISQYQNDLDESFCKEFMKDISKKFEKQVYKKELFLDFLKKTSPDKDCFKF